MFGVGPTPSSGWPTDSQASSEGLCFIVSSGCFCLFVCLIWQILWVHTTASSFVFLWIFCVCKCACLCIHMGFLCFFSLTLFPVWLFLSYSNFFCFLFYLISLLLLFLRWRRDRKWKWGRNWEGYGRGNHNLNILYEKKLFSVLKKRNLGVGDEMSFQILKGRDRMGRVRRTHVGTQR